MLYSRFSKTYLSLLTILLSNNLCISQKIIDSTKNDYVVTSDIRYEDYVYLPTIKTVQLHDESFDMSQPIINIESDEKLKLSFDEMDADFKNYSYTYIHCNSNWEPSNLMPAEFIDGFQDNPINNYRYSVNTLQKYIHYYAVFPSSTSRFSKSGNYILKVYENGNPDNIILTKRFMVFQNKIGIEAKVTRATDVSYMNYNQEVDFTINYGAYKITNPYSDLKIVLTQNNRWDNAKTNLKPLFVKDQELIYELSSENIFPGGSEFRDLNIKSIRNQLSDKVIKIINDSSKNEIYLAPDEKRSFKKYEFSTDLDGGFLIKTQSSTNSEVEGDYCFVHFFLPMAEPEPDGNLYVFGAFNGWGYNRDNLMHYNIKRKGYEATLFLKQGYYNYEYAFLKDGETALDDTLIEGTHYETENNYTIYVYHKQRGTFYEQLIGVKRVNSTSGY
jgi:hypothetical protein